MTSPRSIALDPSASAKSGGSPAAIPSPAGPTTSSAKIGRAEQHAVRLDLARRQHRREAVVDAVLAADDAEPEAAVGEVAVVVERTAVDRRRPVDGARRPRAVAGPTNRLFAMTKLCCVIGVWRFSASSRADERVVVDERAARLLGAAERLELDLLVGTLTSTLRST